MRWPRYSEHLWLRRVRLAATALAIAGTIIGIFIVILNGGTFGSSR